MPITAKPFDVASKIAKRIFYGKPKIYADVDINQAIDVDQYAFQRLGNTVGAYSTGFNPTTPTLTQTSTQLEFEVDCASGGKLFYNKVVYDIPAFNFQRLGGSKITISTRANAVVNFWLVAKKTIVDFDADNDIGGITGTGFAAPIASSDAVVWSDERVEMTIGTDVMPTLGTDEETIILLCQVAYKQDLNNAPVTGGSIAFLQVLVPDEDTINGRVFPTSEDFFSSKTTGLFANLMKLSDYVKTKIAILTADLAPLKVVNFTTITPTTVGSGSSGNINIRRTGNVVSISGYYTQGGSPTTAGIILVSSSSVAILDGMVTDVRWLTCPANSDVDVGTNLANNVSHKVVAILVGDSSLTIQLCSTMAAGTTVNFSTVFVTNIS